MEVGKVGTPTHLGSSLRHSCVGRAGLGPVTSEKPPGWTVTALPVQVHPFGLQPKGNPVRLLHQRESLFLQRSRLTRRLGISGECQIRVGSGCNQRFVKLWNIIRQLRGLLQNLSSTSHLSLQEIEHGKTWRVSTRHKLSRSNSISLKLHCQPMSATTDWARLLRWPWLIQVGALT